METEGQEGEQFADADRALGEEDTRGDDNDADLAQRDEIADAPVDRFQPVQPVEVVPEDAVAGTETADLVIIARECLDHADTGQVFLQDGGQRTFGFVGDFELALYAGEEQVGADGDERHQAKAQCR